MKVELVNGRILEQDTFLVKRWNMLVSVPFNDLKWHDEIVYFIGGNHFKEPHKYDLDKELCYLYGCCCSKTTIHNVCWNDDTIVFTEPKERLKNILDRMMIKYKELANGYFEFNHDIHQIFKRCLKARIGVWKDVFQDDGVLNSKVCQKIINGSKENALAFLEGFFDQSRSFKLPNKPGDYYEIKNEEAQGFFEIMSKIGYDIFICNGENFRLIVNLKKVNEQTMKIVPIKKIHGIT